MKVSGHYQQCSTFQTAELIRQDPSTLEFRQGRIRCGTPLDPELRISSVG
jgi:hypothetical protein